MGRAGGERCRAQLSKINGALELSPEVWLGLPIYPVLLDLQIRLGFREKNLSADISGVTGIATLPLLSPRGGGAELAAAAAALRAGDLR